jgi:protein disulfide isomerase family A protein 3
VEEELETTIIGLFNEDTAESDLEIFKDVAEEMRWDIRWGLSTEDDVRDEYKVKGGFAIYLYMAPRYYSEKYGDKKRARYPGKEVSADSLKKFINAKMLPVVGQKTWKTNSAYDSQKKPIVTLFTEIDHEKNRKGYDYFANRMRKVAVDNKGLKFNIGSKSDFSYLLKDYDDMELEGKKDVGVGIKDGNVYYKMDDKFSVDALRSFVDDFTAGKLKGKVKVEEKHEPTPMEDEDDDGTPDSVIHLNDANFLPIVKDPKTDVMVEFYAPWCGHCKSLKPVYKKVAAAFSDTPSVSLADADATSLEVPPEFDVQGYPTIYWVPASGPAVAYDGAREADDMITFIKKSQTHPSQEL